MITNWVLPGSCRCRADNEARLTVDTAFELPLFAACRASRSAQVAAGAPACRARADPDALRAELLIGSPALSGLAMCYGVTELIRVPQLASTPRVPPQVKSFTYRE